MVFETHLETMYRAGKRDIPHKAAELARAAEKLGRHLETLNWQSGLAGDPAALRHLLHVGDAVYEGLADAVVACNHAALCVIATADDYRRTDDQAAADYARLGNGLKTADVPQARLPDDLGNLGAPGVTVHLPGSGRGDHGTTVTIMPTPAPDVSGTDLADRDRNEDSRTTPVDPGDLYDDEGGH